MKRLRTTIILVAFGILPIGFAQGAPAPTGAAEWPMCNGDAYGTRHSPLTQITPANVSRLRPVWSFVNTMDEASIGWIEKRAGRGGVESYQRNTTSGSTSRFQWSEGNPGGGGNLVGAGEKAWPCQKPPWGNLVAVNVKTGDIAWRVPLGITEQLPEARQRTGRLNWGARSRRPAGWSSSRRATIAASGRQGAGDPAGGGTKSCTACSTVVPSSRNSLAAV